MLLPRVRFTVRRMSVAVALVAILCGIGRWAYDRYMSTPVSRTYYVGDLLGPIEGPTASRPEDQLVGKSRLLKAEVTPDVWWLGRRSVTPFPMTLSLIVRQTESGHLHVSSWLRRQRAGLTLVRGQVSAGPKD